MKFKIKSFLSIMSVIFLFLVFILAILGVWEMVSREIIYDLFFKLLYSFVTVLAISLGVFYILSFNSKK